MKSLRLPAAFLILFSLIAVAGNTLADTRVVLVTNNTPYTLTAFYASWSYGTATDWDTSNNLLAGNTLLPGLTVTVNVNDGTQHCHYDLMGILFGASQYAYQYGVDTCGAGVWNITVSP
jgi:hypothetical protein